MKQTSLASFRKMEDSGKAETQRRKVYKAILEMGIASRKEIAQKLGIPINSVCGRVSELLAEGAIEVKGRKICQVTGEKVEALSIA